MSCVQLRIGYWEVPIVRNFNLMPAAMKKYGIMIFYIFLFGVYSEQSSAESFGKNYKLTIGAGAEVSQKYLGDNEYRILPIPYLSLIFPSGFYIDAIRGIGYSMSLNPRFFVEVRAAYVMGRKDSNQIYGNGSNSLRGMGDIPNSVDAIVTAGYHLTKNGTLSISAQLPVSNRRVGDSYRAQFDYEFSLTPFDTLTASAATTFGSATYNQMQWGVTEIQSLNSGYNKYNADRGFNNFEIGMVWTRQIDRHLSISTSASLATLLGSAKNSPIVKARAGLSIGTLLGYTF